MADYFDRITDKQADLIRQAQVFFVATADPGLEPGAHGVGAVNVSPKGGVPLHVLDEYRVAYLDTRATATRRRATRWRAAPSPSWSARSTGRMLPSCGCTATLP